MSQLIVLYGFTERGKYKIPSTKYKVQSSMLGGIKEDFTWFFHLRHQACSRINSMCFVISIYIKTFDFCRNIKNGANKHMIYYKNNYYLLGDIVYTSYIGHRQKMKTMIHSTLNCLYLRYWQIQHISVHSNWWLKLF